MSYKIYNPYWHLTKSHTLTLQEWERIKARLSIADLNAIENGGCVKVGQAATVWKKNGR